MITADQWDIHFYRIYQDLRDDYAEWEAAVLAEELAVCEVGPRPAEQHPGGGTDA
jgi:hypothetical protein